MKTLSPTDVLVLQSFSPSNRLQVLARCYADYFIPGDVLHPYSRLELKRAINLQDKKRSVRERLAVDNKCFLIAPDYFIALGKKRADFNARDLEDYRSRLRLGFGVTWIKRTQVGFGYRRFAAESGAAKIITEILILNDVIANSVARGLYETEQGRQE